MDRRQRLNDAPSAIDLQMAKRQARMWTALPGIIQSFNAAAMTAEIQPAIQGVKIDPTTGKDSPVNLPLLVDCPVIFPSAGGVSLTLPIAAGDECLVVFSSRCIDAWWQSGGVQPQFEYRMHDLSDGFVIPGVRSKARALAGISGSTAQLRSDDGVTSIEVDPDGQKVNVTAPGGFFVNGVRFDTHVHSGVQAGSAETQGPQDA